MATQNSLATMRHHGVKGAESCQNLSRIVFNPHPRTHLERERKINLIQIFDSKFIVNIIPDVTMGCIIFRLWLNQIKMIRISSIKKRFKPIEFRELRKRRSRFCIREPELIS